MIAEAQQPIVGSARALSPQHRPGGVVLLVMGMMVSAMFCRTTEATTIAKPQTGHAAQLESARSIPWNKMDSAWIPQVRKVVDHPSMFRRMPVEMIQCDEDLFRCLIRYPEVVAGIWQLMGISRVSVQRTGATRFSASDGVGTTSDVQLLYADDSLFVLYCDGDYQGPLFKRRLHGQCVLVIASGAGRGQSGQPLVTTRMDVFLKIDDLGVDALTRTLHPLMGKSADRNFVETLSFVEKISHTAGENGPGMERLAHRLLGVDPEVRIGFAESCMSVYHSQLTAAHLPAVVDARYRNRPTGPEAEDPTYSGQREIAIRSATPSRPDLGARKQR